MATETNEEIVRAYAQAHVTHDDEVLGRYRDRGWIAEMPQSGERIRGHANDRAIARGWPGGRPTSDIHRIVGTEDRWVTTPAWTLERVAGSGDVWWIEAAARYPDGSDWSVVVLLELRGGKVIRERWHFGQAFEAPGWRAAWVERMDGRESTAGR